ncbi:gap junction delta-4 protein [Megalops cyprinoides]|uniref:gap junction delta-4 protein n=1 Tax=Megalops cyprinoides TaxID=118141 RepID=UPI00186564CB|nr:gap junction delta-4 protein [Megalops cyprinoides]
MGRQSASEVLFITLSHNITIVGKIWLVLMILLRVLVLLLAGYPLYQDEQERFVCNTIQPGCANVCYDIFAPVSLFRFWLAQTISVCLPSAIFVVHVAHKVLSGLAAEGCAMSRTKAGPLFKASLGKAAVRAEQGRIRSFTAAYVLHVLLRIFFEAGFGAVHYYLFGFRVPKRFLCHHAPCTTTVDCYVSRPTEKTVMLNFMLGASALFVLLNFADLICAARRSVRQRGKSKVLVEKVYEEEQYYLTPSSRSADANPLARELVVSSAFRKRGASKSSTDEAASVHLGGGDRPAPPRDSRPPPPPSNTNGNNMYTQDPEDGQERDGSEVPLCASAVTAADSTKGTPRPIRVWKHGRVKPPPPPRRDLGPAGGPDPVPASELCGRRVGQYTLVEVTSDLQSSSSDAQEKRSEWV